MSIVTGPGSPQAFNSASGGKVYGYNNISNAGTRTVAPANSNRTSITFHNPGTQSIYVAPANLQNTVGTSPAYPISSTAFTLALGSLGGSFLIAAGATLTIGGECQGAWQAVAASGTTNSLTVMESNLG